MRPLGIDIGKACLGGILATVGLSGCVPGAYVSEYPASHYYVPGYGYSSAAPLGYSSQPGYYGRNYYSPPIVYYGHDHDRRDCRDESHRDRRPPDGHDHRDRDRDGHPRIDDRETRGDDAARPPPRRPPPSRATPVRDEPTRGARETRSPTRRDALVR